MSIDESCSRNGGLYRDYDLLIYEERRGCRTRDFRLPPGRSERRVFKKRLKGETSSTGKASREKFSLCLRWPCYGDWRGKGRNGNIVELLRKDCARVLAPGLSGYGKGGSFNGKFCLAPG